MASEQLERLHRAYLDRYLPKAQREAAWVAMDDFADALTKQLPFKWQALEANNISHGFMDCRRHIHVLEDIQFGRLKRKRGDFLCASNAQYYNRADGPINCKTCLERAERIIAQLQEEAPEECLICLGKVCPACMEYLDGRQCPNCGFWYDEGERPHHLQTITHEPPEE